MKNLYKFRFLTGALLLVLMFCSSCDFEEPDFSDVGNFKVESMAGQQLNIRLSVTCDNPNGFGFKVKRGTLDVSLNGMVVGLLKLDQKVKFKRKSKNIYDLPLSVELAPGGLIKLMQLAGQKDINIRFQGKIRGSVCGIGKTLPIDISRKIDGSMLKFGLGE